MTPGRKLMVLVERISGIVLPDRELQRLTNWALDRAEIKGFADLNSYVEALRRHPDSDEWRVLLSRVTVKESSLFRAPQQFACLGESIVPELVDSGRKSLRVWSAGCARGEEPATIGVILADCLAGRDIRWSVLGTDVDEDALEAARKARFSPRAVRRVPSKYLGRYFSDRVGLFELTGNIRSHIEFESLNLIREPLDVPGPPFDVIFLRNVLIYFRRESQVRVVRNIQKLLAPDGFLLIGPSESLMHLTPVLQAEERQGVFVYRRHDRSEPHDSSSSEPDLPGKREECIEALTFRPQEQPKNELKRGATDPETLAIEGHRAESSGDFRNALRCYRGSLYLRPDLYQVRYRLGICLQRVGWFGRARAEFQAVIELLGGDSGRTLEFFGGPGFPTRTEIESACRIAAQLEPVPMARPE